MKHIMKEGLLLVLNNVLYFQIIGYRSSSSDTRHHRMWTPFNKLTISLIGMKKNIILILLLEHYC